MTEGELIDAIFVDPPITIVTVRCKIHRANGKVEDHIILTDAESVGDWHIDDLNPGDWIEL